MGDILFICTGNYYRSRIAEVLFNYYAGMQGLGWKAESRGLLGGGQLKGLSPVAQRYLKKREIALTEEILRDPKPFTIDDLSRYKLVILLNQSEHLPELERRFEPLVRDLEQRAVLRSWNVFDVPNHANGFLRAIGWVKERASQPDQSATEHIDFAVRSLVVELFHRTK